MLKPKPVPVYKLKAQAPDMLTMPRRKTPYVDKTGLLKAPTFGTAILKKTPLPKALSAGKSMPKTAY